MRLAQPPAERPDTRARIEPLLVRARATGVAVEELDRQHVRLRYDACLHDQWLAVDDLYETVRAYATLEGEGRFEAAPRNWMVIHLDGTACGETIGD